MKKDFIIGIIFGLLIVSLTVFTVIAWEEWNGKRIEKDGDNIKIWSETESLNLEELTQQKTDLERDITHLTKPTTQDIEYCRLDCIDRLDMEYETIKMELTDQLKEINEKLNLFKTIK